MSEQVFKKAENMLQNICGKQVSYVGRSCELVEISFKDAAEMDPHKVNDEYVFHLQCPFRVFKSGKIIVGSDDLAYSASGDDFVDLDKRNSCVFDERCDLLDKEFMSEYVKAVKLNRIGDIHIELTSVMIDIFVAMSTEDESWRFFKLNPDSEHLVFENGCFDFA